MDYEGQSIAHYKILEKLGAGGMGKVYLAEDTKLNRKVALKFLPASLYSNNEMRERFIQEARAASALQHNNICTIHEINETDDGRLYICMDFYEGNTLKDKISDKILSFDQVIDITIQIAKGLNNAHKNNIIHRDIKPGNILITNDGVVKILDFGLAKVSEDSDLTQMGSTLGTTAYMSPEQVAGKNVDHRTDIWSLGVVLYEMITGEKPFKGVYDQAIVYQIIHENPIDPKDQSKEVPEYICEILSKALNKSIDERYQNVSDLIQDLKIKKESAAVCTNSNSFSTQLLQKRKIKRILIPSVSIAAIILIGLSWFNFFNEYDYLNIELVNPVQITGEKGLEINAVISPDGKKIAYEAGPLWYTDILVKDLETDKVINLTENLSGHKRLPVWSSDAAYVSFNFEDDVYTVPASGGDLKILVQHDTIGYPHSITYSPDNMNIAYMKGGNVFKRSITENNEIRINSDSVFFWSHSLNWSPDNKWIVFVEGSGDYLDSDNSLGNISASKICLLNVNDGSVKRLIVTEDLNISPVWLADSRSILFVSNREGRISIFCQNINSSGEPDGETINLHAAINAHTISISHVSGTLIYSNYSHSNNIWSIPIPVSGTSSISEAKRITNWNFDMSGLDVAPGNDRIAFGCEINGQFDIFTIPKSGGEREQITDDEYTDYFPSWSPDGKEIAYHSMRNGNRAICVVSADTKLFNRKPKIIVSDSTQNLSPDWSPDGNTIVYYSYGGNISGLKKISRESTTASWRKPLKVNDKFGSHPRYSPYGKYILYMRARFHIIPSSGGTEKTLLKISDTELHRTIFPVWSEDGNKIYFRGKTKEQHYWEFWSLDLRSNKVTKVITVDNTNEPLDFGVFKTDGERFYFFKPEHDSDIWKLSVSKME